MFKSISVYASFNTQTGYGIHATNFFGELEKLIPIKRNQPGGDAVISLYDSVTASNIKVKHALPSVLFNVFESTKQPVAFCDNLSLYDQLWVPSKWQKECTHKQCPGLGDEFIQVVPEGVDPDIFQPIMDYK